MSTQSRLEQPAMPNRLLRRREVLALVGIGQSTMCDWMARGEFPRPVELGSKLVAWRDSDIADWLAARKVKRS